MDNYNSFLLIYRRNFPIVLFENGKWSKITMTDTTKTYLSIRSLNRYYS